MSLAHTRLCWLKATSRCLFLLGLLSVKLRVDKKCQQIQMKCA